VSAPLMALDLVKDWGLKMASDLETGSEGLMVLATEVKLVC